MKNEREIDPNSDEGRQLIREYIPGFKQFRDGKAPDHMTMRETAGSSVSAQTVGAVIEILDLSAAITTFLSIIERECDVVFRPNERLTITIETPKLRMTFGSMAAGPS